MRKKHAAILISLSMMMNQAMVIADYDTKIDGNTSETLINDSITRDTIDNITSTDSIDDSITEDIIDNTASTDSIDDSSAETTDASVSDVVADDAISDIDKDNTVSDMDKDSTISDVDTDNTISDVDTDHAVTDEVTDDSVSDKSIILNSSDESIKEFLTSQDTSDKVTGELLIPFNDITTDDSSKEKAKDDPNIDHGDSENTGTSPSNNSLFHTINQEIFTPQFRHDDHLWVTNTLGEFTLHTQKPVFPEGINKNNVSILDIYVHIKSDSDSNIKPFEGFITIFLDHTNPYHSVEYSKIPLLEGFNVSVIYLYDSYYIKDLSTILSPNTKAHVALSDDSSFWNNFTEDQLIGIFSNHYPPEIEMLIQNSDGRINSLFYWQSSPPEGYYHEEGLTNSGEIVELSSKTGISGESTEMNNIQNSASVTIYSPYEASPLQDRDLLWLKYSELLSSPNIYLLAPYINADGGMGSLPNGDFIADTVILSDSNMLVLRLANESSSGDLTRASLYADLYSVKDGTVILSDSKLLYRNIGSSLKHLELLSGPGQSNAVLYLEGFLHEQ